MLQANARLILDDTGSDVPVTGITPAEAMILVSMHTDFAKRFPLTDIKVTGVASQIVSPAEFDENGKEITPEKRVPRTDDTERARLRTKYLDNTIKKVFLDPRIKLPDTFDEVQPIPQSAPVQGTRGSWSNEPIKLPSVEP